MALRWEDVDWARNRMTINSPKTEHHHHGASRQIPLFPELLPHLRQAFEEAEPGTEFIITRYRETNQNLRTQLAKIVKRAGLEPWPKLFHNLRSTRETELAETFPLHVVCVCIGNSQRIAAKHYLQVTDNHFSQGAEAADQAAGAPKHHTKQPGLLARSSTNDPINPNGRCKMRCSILPQGPGRRRTHKSVDRPILRFAKR